MIRARAALFMLAAVTAAAAPGPGEAARNWTGEHQDAILQEFSALLSIPNDAHDSAGIERNCSALLAMLARRGVTGKLMRVEGAPPLVYGEIRSPGARRTIVFYAHYDGQPVNPADWQGGAPYEPVFRMVSGERRLFARSSSDDKAAIVAQLTALDALRAAGIALRANIRFAWEGEEEAGSPHLGEILAANREALAGDVWLICDGPVDASGRPTIVFGARGDTHLEVTVYGPKRELHSGHYGNWAPNPAMMLAQLLASMKDGDGRVLVKNFYDGVEPLSAAERAAIAEAPSNDAMLKRELWLGRTEGGGRTLLELINLPTLNINGMASARTGPKSNNVIPSTAVADIDLRLVKGLDWRRQQDRVIEHIRGQGYFVVESPPPPETLMAHPRVAMVKRDEASYNAVRTPMDLPIASDVVDAVRAARGPVVRLPTSGGSVPLEVIEKAVGTKTIMVPIANHDNNQHSANENLRLQNLWDGVETMAALLAMN